MQRRAAAVYVAFFLVLGASAYSVIALAEQPHVDLEGETLGQGDSFEVGGQSYTVSELTTEESSGGGHGGGGGESFVGTLTWTEEGVTLSATLENNSTVTYRGTDYHLLVENNDSFTVTEQPDVAAMLEADDAVENETVARSDGREYVVYEANGSTRPLDAYLPEPDTRTFSTGDDYQYPAESGNVTATVADVTTDGATLEWTGPETHEAELTEGANITLSDTQYVVHFESENQVTLSQNVAGYQQTLRQQDYFHERTNGLWGVVILSGFAMVLLVGMAFMPVRG